MKTTPFNRANPISYSRVETESPLTRRVGEGREEKKRGKG